MAASELFRIVFDGPPGPAGGRFLQVETLDGKSMHVGKWVQAGAHWHLYISAPAVPETAASGHDTQASAVLPGHDSDCALHTGATRPLGPCDCGFTAEPPAGPPPYRIGDCRSDAKGECTWSDCPQNRDNEPRETGRSCPLYDWNRQQSDND